MPGSALNARTLRTLRAVLAVAGARPTAQSCAAHQTAAEKRQRRAAAPYNRHWAIHLSGLARASAS